MAGFWEDWKKDEAWRETSPYINWWRVSPPPEFDDAVGAERSSDPMSTFFRAPFAGGLQGFLAGFAMNRSSTISHVIDKTWSVDNAFGAATKELMRGAFGEVVPMPGNVNNAGFDKHLQDNQDDWMPPPDDLPTAAPDTVIVGIIDSGIPIGSSRLRDRDFRTRVLASWQQGAARPAVGGQAYLPCGVELYRDCIDALIEQNTVGDLFLADDFNRAAGLVDMTNPLGTRVLAGRFAHGAMVADLAAGADPDKSCDRVKLITVNLPNLATLNSSGIFLDYFAILGLKRIADLADAIFNKSKAAGGTRPWPEEGFPIVVNLSFGKNAGSKDGRDIFSDAVTTINRFRAAEKKRPIVVITPVGNHNLEQGNARFDLAPGATDSIAFRTKPEDQTPNYLEIWSDPIPLDPGQTIETVVPPLGISVSPPGTTGEAISAGPHHTLRKGQGDAARLYCELRAGPSGTDYRICYLLCIAPSLSHWRSPSKPLRPTAPAGAWTIRLENRSGGSLGVSLCAQTDQSTRPNSHVGLNPCLEHPAYRRRDQTTGRLLDSCDDAGAFPDGVPDDKAVLRRHGSINATAMGTNVIAVAGYRQSDGRPADYSATGSGVTQQGGRSAPTLAMPTDTSPALFGILGAGAADGSVVAMRGTSFASATATRMAANMLLANQDPSGLLPSLISAAASAEARLNRAMTPAGRTKVGDGRLDPNPRRLIDRTIGRAVEETSPDCRRATGSLRPS